MRRKEVGALVAVAVAAGCVYANTLANGFVMDDRYNVVENEAIRPLDGIPALFGGPLGAQARRGYDENINRNYWRPLTLLSYAVDYQIWQLRPLGYHLTNLLLHTIVSALVLLLLLRLGAGVAAAFVGGMVFALHPVHTEAVNLISYRTELLAALFVVLALILRAGGEERTGSFRDLVVLPLLYACGLASKEIAVTLPGWLLLLDLARGRLHVPVVGERGKALLALGRTYLPLGAVLVGYLLLRQALLEESTVRFFAELGVGPKALSVAKIYRHYLQLLVLPWPLLAFYDWTVLPPASSWLDWEAWLGVGLFCATGASAVLLWRQGGRARLAALGLGWWLVGLVPVLHLVPLPVGAAERFLYLPSVGICLALGQLAESVWLSAARSPGAGRRKAAIAVALGLALAMALGTVQRNTHWRSNLTLQRQATRDFPGCFTAHSNLGDIYRERGQLALAIPAYDRANQILSNVRPNVVRLIEALIADCQHARAARTAQAAIAELGPKLVLTRLLAAARAGGCQ